ncbi:hypothetical protein [Ekhidna sp.]|uniref:hypothetical protein n=1 Tax=Ekhidna sp. TaxID=2608089 RepID=UPI003297BA5D
MRKLPFLLLFIAQLGFGQNAYIDAIKLRNLNPIDSVGKLIFPIGAHIEAADILKKYSNGSNYVQIRRSLRLNKFIGLPPDRSASSSQVSGAGGFIKSIGGLNVTNFADGLASFLVQRSKQELSVTFFEKFSNSFKKYPEFKILFPSTSLTFNVIESFEFSGYLNTLREAFLKDIEVLHINIPKLEMLTDADCSDSNCKTRIGNYVTFFRSDPGYSLKVAFLLVDELKQGTNPAEIISIISESTDFNRLSDPQFSNLKAVVKLSNFISQSLLSEDENKVWVSAKELKEFVADPITFKIYLGLLYQSDDSATITFKFTTGPDQTFREILDNYATVGIAPIEAYVKSFASDIAKVNSVVDNFNNLKKSGGKPRVSDYYTFYDNLISFIDNSASLSGLGLSLNNTSSIDDFMKKARLAGNIYQDFASENYSAAILDIRVFLEEMGIGNPDFQNTFLRYGSFMATVAQAESSEDVHEAIEAIVLPVGSASIKKKTKTNISLNAYVGAFYAEETLHNTPDILKEKEEEWTRGITAPVGVAVSKGYFLGEGSISLFVTLIDLGAIVSYRFQNPVTSSPETIQVDDPATMGMNEELTATATYTVDQLPEITLQNILAPGAYIMYGIPKIPISVGVGAQRGPQLRSIKVSQTITDANGISTNGIESVIESSTWRWGFTIAVDIPLINFYSKSK